MACAFNYCHFPPPPHSHYHPYLRTRHYNTITKYRQVPDYELLLAVGSSIVSHGGPIM